MKPAGWRGCDAKHAAAAARGSNRWPVVAGETKATESCNQLATAATTSKLMVLNYNLTRNPPRTCLREQGAVSRSRFPRFPGVRLSGKKSRSRPAEPSRFGERARAECGARPQRRHARRLDGHDRAGGWGGRPKGRAARLEARIAAAYSLPRALVALVASVSQPIAPPRGRRRLGALTHCGPRH
jgi:hypothetical protein